MRDSAGPAVVVAVATFRRPNDLARILPELVGQAGAAGFAARVVVVDNDPDGSARELVSRWPDAAYVHEPRQGIAAARNRALDEATHADAVVFVDDDELPTEGWLEALVGAWRTWGCAAVAGPAVVRFTGEADDWVRACGLFDTPRREDGQVLSGAATNNLLLDLAVLRRHGLRFDDAYGLSGGSDTRLIHELIRRGGVVRWTTHAQVHDFVPGNRSTRAWALRRTFRTGNAWSRVALDLAAGVGGRPRERLELTARGLHRGVRGVAGVMRGRRRRDLASRARGEMDLATGAGVVLGAWGYRYTEYRRPVAK